MASFHARCLCSYCRIKFSYQVPPWELRWEITQGKYKRMDTWISVLFCDYYNYKHDGIWLSSVQHATFAFINRTTLFSCAFRSVQRVFLIVFLLIFSMHLIDSRLLRRDTLRSVLIGVIPRPSQWEVGENRSQRRNIIFTPLIVRISIKLAWFLFCSDNTLENSISRMPFWYNSTSTWSAFNME